MAKQKKFTFKTEKPTGLYRSFDKPTHHIKFKKHEIGHISDDKPHIIHFRVIKNAVDLAKPGNNKNCEWKWIHLKHESNSLQEAKDFLNTMIDKIFATFTFPED